MAVEFKVSGAWKEPDTAQVRIGGVWKDVESVQAKVSGAWKDVWLAQEDLPTGAFYFDFEDDVLDQSSNDPWDTETNIAYSTDEKYGTKALTPSSAPAGLVDNDAHGILWNADFWMDGWFKPPSMLSTFEDVLTMGGKDNALVVTNTPEDVSGAITSNLPPVIVALSDSKIVVVWNENNLSADYRVGDITGTSISWGSITEWASGNVAIPRMAALSSSRIVIVYRQDNFVHAVIGNVSGTTITFGTPVELGDAVVQNVCALDDTHFVINCRRISDADAYCWVGVVSLGDTITFGSEYKWLAGSVFYSALTRITSTTFAVIAEFDFSTETVIGTVSNGDEIAYGTVYPISTENDQGDIVYLAENLLVGTYKYGKLVKAGTVSGDVISWGSEETLTYGGAGPFTFIQKLSDTSFVVVCDDGGNLYAQIGDITGSTTITLRTAQTIATSISHSGPLAYLRDNVVISAYATSTHVYTEFVPRPSTILRLQIGNTDKANFKFINAESNFELNQAFTISAGYFHFSVHYDVSEDELYVMIGVDDELIDLASAGTLRTTANALSFILPRASYLFDELALDPDTFVAVATSIAYVNSGLPWKLP